MTAFYSLDHSEKEYIQKRVDYYCKFNDEIFLPEDAPTLSKFAYRQKESYVHDYVNSTYFFDAYEYTRFFPDSLRWAYNPGDVNYLFPVPEITKSRPLTDDNGNRNNILLNLDKIRHFTWITDPFSWEEKECRILFRGDATGKPHRQRFIPFAILSVPARWHYMTISTIGILWHLRVTTWHQISNGSCQVTLLLSCPVLPARHGIWKEN